MNNALNEAIEKNDGNQDLSVAFDGTWQKRGHLSLNGVVTSTSFDTGKVIDVAIRSKYCRCKNKYKNEHEVKCCANYIGVSGGMEISGVKEIYERSLERGVRYEHYLGDGDSKAFQQVADSLIYGQDFEIKKLECIGHVQKRMGRRLLDFKKVKEAEKAAEKKKNQTETEKRAKKKKKAPEFKLTGGDILKIQKYYGLAIRRNPTNLEGMKKDIWAEYFHLASSNQNPQHGLCHESWCKYKKSLAEGTQYDHTKHFHLPEHVMLEVKQIFRDLSASGLLSKCLHGKTQNPNESVNNVIWSRLPKINFVALNTLELGVYDAVANFNEGNIAKCDVLRKLGINAGMNCSKIMRELDRARIAKSDRDASEIQKKIRSSKQLAKRKLEDHFETEDNRAGPSYSCGMY